MKMTPAGKTTQTDSRRDILTFRGVILKHDDINNAFDAARVTSAVRRGDAEAFDVFYGRYYDRLYRYAAVMVRHRRDMVEDVMQDAMIRIVRNIRTFEAEDVLWGWLTRVVKTAFIDAVRRVEKHSGAGALPDADFLPSPEEAEDELGETLAEIVDGLDEHERNIVKMKYFDSMTVARIAETLDSTPKAVESKLSRTREKIRARLRERLENEKVG